MSKLEITSLFDLVVSTVLTPLGDGLMLVSHSCILSLEIIFGVFVFTICSFDYTSHWVWILLEIVVPSKWAVDPTLAIFDSSSSLWYILNDLWIIWLVNDLVLCHLLFLFSKLIHLFFNFIH